MKTVSSPISDYFHFRSKRLVLRDGTRVTVRCIMPQDEPRMIAFHQTLSNQSVHFRYFGMLSLESRTGHARLAALCATDPAREIALVAVHERTDGNPEILRVGRLIKSPDRDEAEFAVVVSDRMQSHGLGKALLRSLVVIGKSARVLMLGHILPGNTAMLHVSRDLGFKLLFNEAEGEWLAELNLRPKQTAGGNESL